MAEEQNIPNEKDVKEEVKAETSDVEIEISDDTPEADQNRKNLPKELVERLDSDELTEYDDKVKDKIYQLKKVWHDERREKERVIRENQEAIKAAQQLLNENKQLKTRFVDTETNAAGLELESAKKQYKEAYELGDSEKMLAAQEVLNAASIRSDKVKSLKTPLQKEESSVQKENTAQPAALPPDAKAMEWQKKNDWFGQDEEMTSLALGLHEKLVKQNGISYATTDEYYTVINDTMRKRFPENFNSDDVNVETKVRSSAVVAPVTRTTSSKKVRLSTSQINLAKKLGLTPKQYAEELIRLESKNG